MRPSAFVLLATLAAATPLAAQETPTERDAAKDTGTKVKINHYGWDSGESTATLNLRLPTHNSQRTALLRARE
jgi:ABC-type proline/glycine betaine transport system substrate-binding protein